MERKTHKNDEAMSYIFPMSLLLAGTATVAWILLMQGVGEIGLSFDMFVEDGTMSAQTATVAANAGALFGAFPIVLLFGWFAFNMVSAANLRNAGWAGSVTPFANGAILMLCAFVMAYVVSLAFGTIVDQMETEMLDPTDPLSDIPEDWQDAQGATVPFGINMLMLCPYFIEGVGMFVFFQSILSATSGGAQYASRGGGYY